MLHGNAAVAAVNGGDWTPRDERRGTSASEAETEAEALNKWRDDMRRFLARTPWSHFASLSYKDHRRPLDEAHPQRRTRGSRLTSHIARLSVERWQRGLERDRGEPLLLFVVEEDGGESHHLLNCHALIANAHLFKPRDLQERWMPYGLAKVTRYDAERDVGYVLKKLGPDSDARRWWMSPPLPSRIKRRLAVMRGVRLG